MTNANKDPRGMLDMSSTDGGLITPGEMPYERPRTSQALNILEPTGKQHNEPSSGSARIFGNIYTFQGWLTLCPFETA